MTRFKVFTIFLIIFLALVVYLMGASDRVINAHRAYDTLVPGDYSVHVNGFDKPFLVKNSKVTSVPEKGYYVMYIQSENGKQLLQSPIQQTTILKID